MRANIGPWPGPDKRGDGFANYVVWLVPVGSAQDEALFEQADQAIILTGPTGVDLGTAR